MCWIKLRKPKDCCRLLFGLMCTMWNEVDFTNMSYLKIEFSNLLIFAIYNIYRHMHTFTKLSRFVIVTFSFVLTKSIKSKCGCYQVLEDAYNAAYSWKRHITNDNEWTPVSYGFSKVIWSIFKIIVMFGCIRSICASFLPNAIHDWKPFRIYSTYLAPL